MLKQLSGLSTNTISELTANSGVTVDGVKLKDGNIETPSTAATPSYIKDSHGNEVVALLAGSTNTDYPELGGGIGGGSLGVEGSSTNIDLAFYAKGAGIVKSYNGSTFSQVATVGHTQTLTNKTLTAPVINNPTGFLTGAAKITVSSTAPSSPTTGDLWVDTN